MGSGIRDRADLPAEENEPFGSGTDRECRVLWEVQSSTLRKVAVLSCVLGYLMACYAAIAYRMEPQWSAFLALLLFIVTGALTLGSRLGYRTKALTLTVGLWVGTMLASSSFPGPGTGIGYSMICLVAGILLGPTAALASAGVGTGVLIAQSLLLPTAPPLMGSLVALWISAALVRIAIDDLYRAVIRSEASAQAAWAQARASLVRKGELNAVVHSLEEATRRIERINHELNQARFEAEMARTLKARFATTVSHEIRGPLNLILGFSRMMVLSPEHYGRPLPPSYRADMDTVYRNSEHLASLVDDVIDLSQIEAKRMPLVRDCVDLVKEVIAEAVSIVRPLAEGKGLAIRIESTSTLPAVFVDPVRLRQVMLNLLMNAVRFTRRGGITITVGASNGEVLVEVQDTGAGIGEKDIPKLFKEFSQVHEGMLQAEKGSGLGLSISKYLVELHGGRIWVESHQGSGTVVRFTLPLLAGEDAPSFRLTERAAPASAPRNILVLHSDPYVVRVLGRFLDGYRVVGTADESHARGLVEDLHPSAIITTPDVGERIASLMSEFPDVPLITLGLAQPDEQQTLNGLVGYLVKPVTPEVLLAAMKRVDGRADMQVLLVDDEVDAVRLLERMLTSLPRPYQILKAYDGEQAWDLMQDTVPDIVFVDLMMPRLDGQGVIERMRADERLRRVPVIAVSARDAIPGTVMVDMPIIVTRQESITAADAAQCLKAILDTIRPTYLPPAEPRGQSVAVSGGLSASAAPGLRPMPKQDAVGSTQSR